MATRRSASKTDPGEQAIAFLERHCTHIKGQWAGQPLRLEPWQRSIVSDLFGTVDRKSGLRRYRTALIGVGRKNGKSLIAAGLALKLLLADKEPGAEVYSAAGDREQARIVFGTAKAMIDADPALSARCKIYQNSIVVPKTQSVYKVLSADGFRAHGLNPHGVVVDELHVLAGAKGRDLWEALTTGQGARRQPLTLAITTAGFDRQSICYELFDHGRKVETRQVDDPAFYFRWFGADETDDWTAPEVWAEANPNLGVSVSMDFLENEFRQAQLIAARQNTFRRLYLNQWTSADVRWLDLGLWDSNAGMTVREDDLAGRQCYGGLDLASTSDFAALVWVFPDEQTGQVTVLPRFWLPQAAVERRSQMRHMLEVWQREGWLTVTDGDVIDYDHILAQFDRDATRFDVVEVAFDPWNAGQLTQRLHEGGMTVWPCRQTITALTGPSKELERLLGERQLRHGGNPILRWMADNVTVTSDSNGNIKPDRKKSTEKIDGIVALVMALAAEGRERETAVAPFAMHL